MLRMPESAGGDLLEAAVGKLYFYAGTTDPTDGLICDGRTISYNEFPELTEFLNNMYQTGNPRNDVNLPDCRGVFLRGLGGLSGKMGILQNDAMRRINGSFRVTVQHQTYDGDKVDGCFRIKNVVYRGDGGEVSARETFDYEFDNNRVVNTAEENRPTNMAFNIVIGTGRLTKKS